ncbi:lysophospholipid acyltransferase 7 [Nephila pilipes]|uniref:Lysophospholipid acyltransferase 7 n=1 Tax=Nephila pilipes TaxID=299642 RepID=A0A8X6QAA7_NEPPI|nr:lysophospholipid acyltransferase 7 [Nephila pilipes]
MILDDIIYISLLCISVALGPVIRNVPNIFYRQLFSTIAGFIIVFIVSGSHIFHSFLVTFINALIIKFLKRKCHIVSSVFCFGYLAFFGSTHYFGLPIPPTHTNAIQMILTLKMVGLAFEIQGTRIDDKTKLLKNADLLKKYQKINPSFVDVFHYAFCIAGVLIGPYYKFRTYWDSLHLPYSSHVFANKFLKDRIRIVPLYVLLYLVGNYLYPLEVMKNIYEYGSEFWPTIREGIQSWNRTVQFWLATFVYKRLTLSKPAKICITMLVSAFWHGVHPGYYLCLCSAPLFLFVETEVEKAFKHSAPYFQQVIFD